MFLTEKLVDKVIDISTVGYRLIVIKILVQKKEEKERRVRNCNQSC